MKTSPKVLSLASAKGAPADSVCNGSALPPIEQVSVVLHEIRQLAFGIKELSISITSGEDDHGALSLAVTAMSAQIGALADLASKQLTGDPGMFGGFDKWILPPAYHDAAKQDEAETS